MAAHDASLAPEDDEFVAWLLESGPEPSAFLAVREGAASWSVVQVALYGATVVSWRTGVRGDDLGARGPTSGEERLWTSSLSARDGSAPIRGGVPIAFPQFADDGPLPLHGFARTLRWTYAGAKGRDDGGSTKEGAARAITGSFRLTRADYGPEATMGWDRDFALEYEVTVRAMDAPADRRGLSLKLSVTAGVDPIAFTSCLHTYLRLDDVRNYRLRGLGDTDYYDKVAKDWGHEETCRTFLVEAAARDSGKRLGDESQGFVDRIYKHGGGSQLLRVQCGDGPSFNLSQTGFNDTVVFNPWDVGKKGDRGPDFDDDGYNVMLCVEPAATLKGSGPVELGPGETWKGGQDITLSCSGAF